MKSAHYAAIFQANDPLGRRRTRVGTPSAVDVPPEAIIDREPVTVVCSLKGWVQAMRGHVGEEVEIKYKEGDWGRFKLHAETTDKLLVFASDGRFYTLGIDKLPGGRGHGEPIRLLIELAENVEIVALRVFDPGETLLVASDDGRGFQVAARDVVAQTKNGRQVLVPGGGRAGLDLHAHPGRRRSFGGGRRQPQTTGLPACRSADVDARQGGHPATI